MMNEDVRKIVENTAFITLVTLGEDGSPHPIVAGKAEIQNGNLVFGIYKMEKTQKNLKTNPNVWVVAAAMVEGPKGYRFSGTALAKDKQLIFTVKNIEELI